MQTLTVVTSLVIANTGQAGIFDGPYLQGGIGGVSSEVDTSYPSELGYLPSFDTKPSKTNSSLVGQILAGYSFSMDRFNFAGSAFYNIGNQVTGVNTYSASGSYGSVSGSISGSQSFKLENTWGLNLEPGFYVSDTTLAFLKLSYINTTAQYNGNANATIHWDAYTLGTYTGSTKNSHSLDGIGFGIGIKQKISENLYGYAEYQRVNYSTWTDNYLFTSSYPSNYSFSQNYGWVGVGYNF